MVSTVNDYYSYVSNPGHSAAIEKASEKISGNGKSATNEELQALVDAIPAGFKYFDTSTPDLIKNAYVQLIMGSRSMGNAAIKLDVPSDAVSVDGDNATVDVSKTETLLNGKKIEAPASPGMLALKLKKNNAGTWVMIAEGVPNLTVNNGFAAALTGVKKAS